MNEKDRSGEAELKLIKGGCGTLSFRIPAVGRYATKRLHELAHLRIGHLPVQPLGERHVLERLKVDAYERRQESRSLLLRKWLKESGGHEGATSNRQGVRAALPKGEAPVRASVGRIYCNAQPSETRHGSATLVQSVGSQIEFVTVLLDGPRPDAQIPRVVNDDGPSAELAQTYCRRKSAQPASHNRNTALHGSVVHTLEPLRALRPVQRPPDACRSPLLGSSQWPGPLTRHQVSESRARAWLGRWP